MVEDNEKFRIFDNILDHIEPYVIGILGMNIDALTMLENLILSQEGGEHFKIPLIDILKKPRVEWTTEELEYVNKSKDDKKIELVWVD